ncbi:hypothetical protein BCR33DRAFT_237024 [Rhizoclosmatium globosum]|uniref:Uncharacterized protein n=1 Tax=Rhizoclosmatium globosum TaxID=329046 RepID=A0A1Y2CAY1_9FUNG|nr:hypothetical protein BCR33DRAFT_237024 [Rhizoclosmatium globosum]|eukprot:ORY44189.1 hypothetical protein BCR33DRAFT_237024 [Rhizoclosmatium globosum]
MDPIQQNSTGSKLNLRKSVLSDTAQGIRLTPDDYTIDMAANVTAPQSMFAGPKNRFANTSSSNPRRIFPPSDSNKSQSTNRSPGHSPATSRDRPKKIIKRSASQQSSLTSKTSSESFQNMDFIQPLDEVVPMKEASINRQHRNQIHYLAMQIGVNEVLIPLKLS